MFVFLTVFIVGMMHFRALGQKRPTSKKSVPVARVVPQTPFNFLIGNWASYSQEATFAAYCNVKAIASGTALEIHLEKPDKTMSVGLIYSDALDDRWKMVWVGPDVNTMHSNGVRYYESSYDRNLYFFQGKTIFNGKSVKDRFMFENINNDTVVFSYELSTDNEKTWDIEFRFTFKKNNSQ
ncbi:MAG TPA: hypothetical protein PLC76_02300 [Saprospiraceae bacterium]|nr:hypothetical protein [Candidatus Parvibacillus calidus]MBX2936698.1 hypothetical protein [Saprospiraceae bacterium]MBX7180143.1 hypothetical protein [Saprospiraceae bacterium]MCB0590629.1 hypothetical protein [Saprospiraceae bacterium]MCO5282813.1 hypothetical protein [Saprospiraceae bacterium]